MKGYRKPSGVYIEVHDHTPVNEKLIEVALRPSHDHVLADNWKDDPTDPAVCWRTPNADEAREKVIKEVDDSVNSNPVLRAILDVTPGLREKVVAEILAHK